MWIFPHQQAEKSLQNQHVLSVLQVGSHQLQYRFFRTKKWKSHHKTNTFCPITLACRIVGEDRWCRRCGCQGEARDTVIRRLAHEPYGWRPTIVHVSVRRYRCQECAHVWRQDMSQAADPRAKLSRAAVRWALTGLVVHHLTVARIAQALGVSWKSR